MQPVGLTLPRERFEASNPRVAVAPGARGPPVKTKEFPWRLTCAFHTFRSCTRARELYVTVTVQFRAPPAVFVTCTAPTKPRSQFELAE